MIRAIPSAFDPVVVAAVDVALDEVVREHGVRMPLAVESGSRAWGFPSPDSDYDCRFVYVRPLARHLTPWRERDVIERPLSGLLDVNGWDLAKALGLLIRGNAVLLEWLTSPVVYRAEARFRDKFLALARRLARPERVARHYLHLRRQQRLHFGDPTAAPSGKEMGRLPGAGDAAGVHRGGVRASGGER